MELWTERIASRALGRLLLQFQGGFIVITIAIASPSGCSGEIIREPFNTRRRGTFQCLHLHNLPRWTSGPSIVLFRQAFAREHPVRNFLWVFTFITNGRPCFMNLMRSSPSFCSPRDFRPFSEFL